MWFFYLHMVQCHWILLFVLSNRIDKRFSRLKFDSNLQNSFYFNLSCSSFLWKNFNFLRLDNRLRIGDIGDSYSIRLSEAIADRVIVCPENDKLQMTSDSIAMLKSLHPVQPFHFLESEMTILHYRVTVTITVTTTTKWQLSKWWRCSTVKTCPKLMSK